jgi:hypothetical protein
LAVTPTRNGIVDVPAPSGTGVFAVAMVNVGATGPISVSADTNGVALPLTVSLCPTFAAGHPMEGQCMTPPTLAVEGHVIASGGTSSFGVFATGSGTVAFDPALHRIFVRLKDQGGVVRGWTSVAVRSSP